MASENPRPGQPERFGMDTRSVNAQAKRWLSIMNRTKAEEGFEQFHARLKTRLEEVVRNTDELIRNPKMEEEIGGWEFDDLSRAVNSVIGYGNATRGYAEALLGRFSRPGAKDTMAVEDRFYFGKERFAEKNDGWALQSVNVPDWGTHHFPSEAAARKYAVEKGYNYEMRLLYNGKTVAIKRWDNTWSNR